MRLISGTFLAVAIAAGAMTGAAVMPAAAQGVYIQGPGFGVGIGRPAYRDPYYYRSYRGYRGYDAYAYSGRPYLRAHPRHSRWWWRHHRW